MPGCFVVIEGGEGSGKSTQVALLGERLRDFGKPHRVTREPGGTPRGEKIRDLLLHDHDALEPRAELLLLIADRAQHVAEVIRPALEAGEIVVSDRFVPSTLAYQGIGRGLGVEEVERLSTWATGEIEPDLVILLDVSESVAGNRVGGPRDRLEQAGAEFHMSVREAYRMLAPLYRWTVIDGSGTIEAVAEEIWAEVRKILP